MIKVLIDNDVISSSDVVNSATKTGKEVTWGDIRIPSETFA